MIGRRFRCHRIIEKLGDGWVSSTRLMGSMFQTAASAPEILYIAVEHNCCITLTGIA